MKVYFKVIANDKDITEEIAKRLISIKTTDKDGMDSDSAEIILDDRDSRLEIPSRSLKQQIDLEISLGYVGNLQKMGDFTIDEVEISSPPQTLTIKAKAINMLSDIRSPRTQSYDNMNIGDIINMIASRNKVSYRIPVDISNIKIDHVDQTCESDIHFLTRLSRNYDVLFKIAGSTLIFVKNAMGEFANKNMIPTIVVDKTQISRWRYRSGKRNSYNTVVATWQNKCAAKEETTMAGTGETPVYYLKHHYANLAEAQKAAGSVLKSLNRGDCKLSLTIPGNPVLIAETSLQINGLRPEIDGEWIITQASHIMDNSGFKTEIEAEVPNKNLFKNIT